MLGVRHVHQAGKRVPDVSEGPFELRARDLEMLEVRYDLRELRKIICTLGALPHSRADVIGKYGVQGLRSPT